MPKFTAAQLAQDATLIVDVKGALFYEHPVYGDEHPLLAVICGEVVTTDFYDADDEEELDEWVNDFLQS